MGTSSYCGDLYLTGTRCCSLRFQVKMNADLFLYLCCHLVHHLTVQTFCHCMCLARNNIDLDSSIKRYQSWQCLRWCKTCGKMTVQSAFFHIGHRESGIWRKGHRSFFFHFVVVGNIRTAALLICSQNQTGILC